MSKLFKTKIRNVGTSLGMLIPKDVVEGENLKEGQELEVVIIKKNFRLMEEAFGIAKGAKYSFKRDKRDRY